MDHVAGLDDNAGNRVDAGADVAEVGDDAEVDEVDCVDEADRAGFDNIVRLDANVGQANELATSPV